MIATEKPEIAERYESAGNTDDLTVGGAMVPAGHKTGHGDVILAAGLSSSFAHAGEPGRFYARQLGMALLRLHSEWSSASRPRPPTVEQIQTMARALAEEDGRRKINDREYAPARSAVARSHEEARKWYRNELTLFALRLRSKSAVMAQLRAWGEPRGVSEEVLAQALLRWLDQACHECEGRGAQKIPDQPALSAKLCHRCQGSGQEPRPVGTTEVLNVMDEAVCKARSALRKRLRS